MAEIRLHRDRDRGLQSMLPSDGPSTQQILAVVTLFPIACVLLCLAGLILAGTLIGLAVMTPLFVIFSPVLVPAALTIALALAGFLTSGAFGVTGLSSFAWLVNNYMPQITGRVPQHLDRAKYWRMQDTASHMGQMTKDPTGLKVQET